MLTIITALYKSDRYLEGYLRHLWSAVEEFRRADFPFEIVFVPQLPGEKEKRLLASVAGEPWCRIQENRRPSLYAAWNTGVKVAKGEACGFWNADDVRYPQAIIDGFKMIKEGAELVYFPFWYLRYVRILGARILVKKVLVKPPLFDRREFSRSMHCGPFFIFSKDLYRKVGPFDEQFKIVGDFDWCVRAAKIAEFKLCPMPAGRFLNEGVSLSGSKDPLHRVENNVVYIRHSAKDKIEKVDDGLMKRYNPDKIFYDENQMI